MSLSTLKPQRRNALTVKKKMELIKTAESNPKLGVRKLAELYECGKTQISSIMKEKQSILELYEANMTSESVQSRKRTRPCEYSDINKALHEYSDINKALHE